MKDKIIYIYIYVCIYVYMYNVQCTNIKQWMTNLGVANNYHNKN